MNKTGRLPRIEHFRQPWRIHAIANDFRVEDVWALPTPGGPDDFPRLLEVMASFDPERSSPILRTLFALRWKLGSRLGLDRPGAGLDRRVASLSSRLPADLTASLTLPADSPFRPVYVTDREAALEIANETVHGVMHLGWVQNGDGGYRGQMAVLVTPNGILGRAYLAAIAPIRYAVVYPMMLTAVERQWGATARQIPVPDFVPRLSLLPRVDYADAFVVDAGAHPYRRAEEWARAILEETGETTQLRAAWTALGLRVDDDSGVAGWRIRRSDPDTVLLGADSRVGMPGELVVAVRGDDLVFATMVSHRTPATRLVWAAVVPGHVAKVRHLLTRAGVSTESVASGRR